MPITTDRFLALLAAGEDALQALGEAERLCRRELELARQRGEVAPGLENLALMVKADFLLATPGATMATLLAERAFYSPTRLGINRRARLRQTRLRQKKGEE